jgi:hypothetical protein
VLLAAGLLRKLLMDAFPSLTNDAKFILGFG